MLLLAAVDANIVTLWMLPRRTPDVHGPRPSAAARDDEVQEQLLLHPCQLLQPGGSQRREPEADAQVHLHHLVAPEVLREELLVLRVPAPQRRAATVVPKEGLQVQLQALEQRRPILPAAANGFQDAPVLHQLPRAGALHGAADDDGGAGALERPLAGPVRGTALLLLLCRRAMTRRRAPSGVAAAAPRSAPRPAAGARSRAPTSLPCHHALARRLCQHAGPGRPLHVPACASPRRLRPELRSRLAQTPSLFKCLGLGATAGLREPSAPHAQLARGTC
eukprot:scaffold7246_cov410-Prasinococcus_capsulatus_cf.AAC.2